MWFFYNPISLIILLPGLLLGIYAQIRVNSAFKKYSNVYAKSNMPACDVADRLLKSNGVYGVPCRAISGHLTDNYNPSSNVLSLSDKVYGSSSLAAIGIAAHETGHAVQHNEGYLPLKIRSGMVKVTNIGTMLAFPLAILGVILEWIVSINSLGLLADILITAGILLYGLSTIFSLVTLPVEFNASRRACKMLVSEGVLTKDEVKGAKKVLSAAALTYVAAFITAFLYFLRFVIIIASLRRKD